MVAADPRPIFVVSTGRSGSTLLSSMLGQHPELLSLSEFMSYLQPGGFPTHMIDGAGFASHLTKLRRPAALLLRHRLDPPGEFLYPLDGGGRFDRETVPAISVVTLPHLTADPDHLYDEIMSFASARPLAPINDHYRSLFGWLRRDMGRQSVVERSGMSTMWLRDLLSQFPEARFVHMYRDGRDCAISMSRHNGYRVVAALRALERASGLELLAPESIPPAPASLPPHLRLLWPDRFSADALNRFGLSVTACGATWSKLTLRTLRLLRHVPRDCLYDLSYEDLVSEPRSALASLARFLGVDADPSWIERSACLARPRPPTHLSLDPSTSSALNSTCRMAMRRLYGDRWQEAGVTQRSWAEAGALRSERSGK